MDAAAAPTRARRTVLRGGRVLDPTSADSSGSPAEPGSGPTALAVEDGRVVRDTPLPRRSLAARITDEVVAP